MLKQIQTKPQECYVNYFRFKTTGQYYKYQLQFNPEFPDLFSEAEKEKGHPKLIKMQKLCFPFLKESFKKFTIQNQLVFYSPESVEDYSFIIKWELKEETEETKEIKVFVSRLGCIDPNQPEHINIMGRFFKTLQASLKFQCFGKAYFDTSMSRQLEDHNIETWPGYQSQVKLLNDQILLCIDSRTKVLRKDSALQYINEMRNAGKNHEFINDAFTNITIVTYYNKRNYKINSIDFSQTPLTNFKLSNGQTQSYLDYYQQRYQMKIKDLNQPLLKHIDKKDENKIVYLIPELCCMTGLTEKHRSDFGLMKEIAKDTKQEPQKKFDQIQKLIEKIYSSKNPSDIMKYNKIEIDKNPLSVQSFVLDAGSFILGSDVKVQVDDSRDFEKRTQVQMLDQRPLNKWAIFYNSRDYEYYELFSRELQSTLKQYNYNCNGPKIVEVNSNNFMEWQKSMSILSPDVDIAVFILPGQKKNAPLYNDIKNYCHNTVGIPCQVVLTKTLQGKGIRSICIKILTQMCAKIGGTPWTMSDMPFTEIPTMIMGIDMYQKIEKSKKYVTAVISTVDRNFARYHSEVNMKKDLNDAHQSIYQMVRNSFEVFNSIISRYPQRIIVYREGPSSGQIKNILEQEVQSIKKVIHDLGMNCKLVFIVINKQVSAKIFKVIENKSYSNPNSGTIIDSIIVEPGSFFLVSQTNKPGQGISHPVKYSIIYNDYGQDQQIIRQLQVLTFKQSHMYFNWTGAIKVPSPCQNANILVNFFGERFNSININPELIKKNIQYYI